MPRYLSDLPVTILQEHLNDIEMRLGPDCETAQIYRATIARKRQQVRSSRQRSPSQLTRGPWHLKDSIVIKFEGGGDQEFLWIDNLSKDSDYTTDAIALVPAENPEDARVIAAAPELLQALEDMTHRWTDEWGDSYDGVLGFILKQADEAILKATETTNGRPTPDNPSPE